MTDHSWPLAVHPWPPTEEQKEAMIRARETVGIPCVFVEGVSGSPGRVLALGKRPWWICRWAFVRPENTTNVDSIAAALRWIVAEPEESYDQWNEEHWLSEVLGVPVRYSHSEDETGKVEFAR